MDRALAKKSKTRLDRTIGQNIRLERELRKMSREELAEVLDLTVSHMGLIERGERGATAVTMEKLSKFFDVPIDHLFAENEASSSSVHEDGNDAASGNIKKISSLITRLNERETDLVIDVIKGLISMHSTGSPQNGAV